MKLLLHLYWIFFKIGSVTFGGGYAMISLIQQEVVSKGLCSDVEFADMVALSQMTPGPLALNTATYLGKTSAGFAGALAATLGLVTPSLILTSLVIWLSGKMTTGRWKGAVRGIRSAAAGLIFSAVWFFAESSLFIRKPFSGGLLSHNLQFQQPGFKLMGWLIFSLSLLAAWKWKRPSYQIILFSLIFGILWYGGMLLIL